MDKNEDNKFNTPFSICKLDIQYETPFIVNKKVIDYLIKTRDDMNVSVAHLYT